MNGFWVTEQTQPYCKIYYFQFQRAITQRICNPELTWMVLKLQSGRDFVLETATYKVQKGKTQKV